MFNKKLFILILGVVVCVSTASSARAEDVVPPATPPTPVCSNTNLDLCNTEALCVGVSLYWYGGVCNLAAQAPVVPDTSSVDSTPSACTAPQILVNNVCTDPALVVVPVCTAPQILVNNVCTDPAPGPVVTNPIINQNVPVVVQEQNEPIPVQNILQTNIPAPQPVIVSEPKLEPVPDKSTSPSSAKLTVLMPDGSVPPFPVFVTFVGVGNKNYGDKINSNGEANVIIPSGRYYTDVMPINTDYVQGEDGPSFFMDANATRDFGVIKLKLKSEATNQNLQDKTLEDNIIKEAQTEGGIGKILALIVKLLMKILEAITALAAK